MFISLSLGPTWTKIGPSPLALFFFSTYSIFFNKSKWKMVKGSNGNEKLQIIYRWKALTKKSSLKQLFSKMVYYTSLASEEKEIGYKVQSSDLTSNWTNWRFREAQVGPTMLLKPLLVQNHHSLHDFLDGVGAQDHSLILTVDSNWFLRGKELESKQRRGSYH
jgi:hypothetical protein